LAAEVSPIPIATSRKMRSFGSLMTVRKRITESEPTRPRERATLLPIAIMIIATAGDIRIRVTKKDRV
jgi:hypothetical protein